MQKSPPRLLDRSVSSSLPPSHFWQFLDLNPILPPSWLPPCQAHAALRPNQTASKMDKPEYPTCKRQNYKGMDNLKYKMPTTCLESSKPLLNLTVELCHIQYANMISKQIVIRRHIMFRNLQDKKNIMLT